MNNKFYVYAHIRNDTGEVFYVGKGCGRRAYEKDNRNIYWKRIVNKYGYEIEILFNNLSEHEALTLEIEMIDKYGRKDLGLGLLVNLTDGGDGGSNPSIETRDKLSSYASNRTQEHKDKIIVGRSWYKHSPETIAKINEKNSLKRAASSLKASLKLKGRKFTPEQRKKLSKASAKIWLGKIPPNAKKVVTQFGDLFNSFKEAAIWCSGDQSSICACARGKQTYSGKHPDTGVKLIWRYADAI